ncbi:MAG: hypothetical protein J1E78_06710, partial [Muribaculaceae bacterium]|nr:hypothetical protein [Muribaculaceae bacterium]
IALGAVACTDKDMAPEDVTTPDEVGTEQTVTSNLTTVRLATFAGDESRIVYEPGTRDDDGIKNGELKLIATIANPDKEVNSAYTDGSGVRYLSATSVFKNPLDNKYYVTYHFQGNNYNTELEKSIGGAIQIFDYTNGNVNLGDGFYASDPTKEDYDFNHIFFDQKSNRIVVVGHKWSVPSSWTSDEPYNGENTRAIIGTFDPLTNNLTLSNITTSIEVRDDNGKLIDHEDAGDGNCVIRIYDEYYLATRKGIAVLSARDENLYSPILNDDETRYFVPTPGSCKFVYNAPGDDTRMFYLYLSEDKENVKDQTSEAKIAEFKVATSGSASESTFIGLINEDTRQTFFNSYDLNLSSYTGQFTLPEMVSPIDGKNGICVIDNAKIYAALGTGGVYFKHDDYYRNGQPTEGVIDIFGNRPVNFVYADDGGGESYHGGFVYVANGARLTILDRVSMKEVASYTLSAKDGIEDNTASANFISVEKGENYPITNGEYTSTVKERIITVAYGQAGVRIFRFIPKVSPAFPN